MSKPKTQAQLDRVADLRLQKTYGITLEEYNRLLEDGDGRCWICGVEPLARRLHVDHDHGWKKIKIESKKYDGCGEWHSKSVYNGKEHYGRGTTKSLSLKDVKIELRRASVRGLCCSWCNRGLRFYHDDPALLKNAAGYLINFADGQTTRILEEK